MLPELLFLIVFSYLIGSISSAIIVCRAHNLPDPRTHGSNNPGATNVLRIGGKKAALITLIADGLKGAIPVFVAHYLGLDLVSLSLIALAAFLGHVYPIFFGFKGGKGIATFLGGLLALNFWLGLGFALTWLFVAKALKISSFSALIATFLTPIYAWFLLDNLTATGVILLICVWIFITHRSNISRLISGSENKI